VTVWGQVYHRDIKPTTKTNSACHSSGACKSSTGMPGWS